MGARGPDLVSQAEHEQQCPCRRVRNQSALREHGGKVPVKTALVSLYLPRRSGSRVCGDVGGEGPCFVSCREKRFQSDNAGGGAVTRLSETKAGRNGKPMPCPDSRCS
ncbi:hypothetical protein MTO96_006969 [Rhipicephalus appendiculatus]